MSLFEPFIVKPNSKIKLKDFDPRYLNNFEYKDIRIDKKELKERSPEVLKASIERLAEFQDKLYAQNTYALLCIFQAMDAAGKDGTIKHVMSGVNPQGCQVFSFKQPSAEELDHDYLWRYSKAVPERGRIGIFNRSYYEEVLVVRVHPELLERQQLPASLKESSKVWKQRFEEINNFEKYLVNNGVVILKFFLNVSKEEQKERFMKRLELPEKNWKFSAADVKERQLWDKYMDAYEDVFNNTSTEWAPWYIIPADRKWYTRLIVGAIIHETLANLGLAYPEVTAAQKITLAEAKQLLEQEP
ncbi:polyphosphate kinase 2 family protein [Leptolyngbya sp. FACHB-16]|uniref:polyphosphate kinase 2 family protein n=1 Tax=unclassified Leptolyngbya TaxID=2650499 RepID=UPI0016880920|nr:polyphosphate kinase 2 family protein [Leptolyngbya sp. FACHB-16]MBD2155882.1 polyphosphate kinase 2 family protein [Leptolyngbya sp. FACHB-16]